MEDINSISLKNHLHSDQPAIFCFFSPKKKKIKSFYCFSFETLLKHSATYLCQHSAPTLLNKSFITINKKPKTFFFETNKFTFLFCSDSSKFFLTTAFISFWFVSTPSTPHIIRLFDILFPPDQVSRKNVIKQQQRKPSQQRSKSRQSEFS